MTANASAVSQDPNLPKPHTCPWIVQYLLVSPLRRLVEPAEKLLSPFVEPGMTVVEPGCGFGYVSLALARLVGDEGRVVSVDVEPRAVERLNRKARRKKLAERIHARVCGDTDFGLADFNGQADRVVVVHTLHEFQDLPGALAQIKALLKPDGKLVVFEPLGHVTAEQFEAELRACERAGFTLLDRPDTGRKRMGAVLGVG